MLVYEIKPLLEIHIFPHFPNNSFCEVKPFLHIWNPCFDNFYPILIILMKLCYRHLDHWLNTKSPAVELRFAAELWNSRVLVQFFSSVQFSATLLLSHSAMLRFVVECAVSCIPTSVLLCALSYSSALLLYSEDPQQSFCTVYRSCATPCVLCTVYCHSTTVLLYTVLY